MKHSLLPTLLLLFLTGCDRNENQEKLNQKEAPIAIGNALEPLNPNVKIGVEACDKLLTKYRTCLDQLPTENRSHLENGMVKAEEAWKTIAQENNATQKLTDACIEMDNSLETTMTAQGCQWE